MAGAGRDGFEIVWVAADDDVTTRERPDDDGGIYYVCRRRMHAGDASGPGARFVQVFDATPAQQPGKLRLRAATPRLGEYARGYDRPFATLE